MYSKLYIAWLILCLLLSVQAPAEIIDRIVAVVNDEVITLTDVKIVEAFGLYTNEEDRSGPSTQTDVLNQLIDQKLVIQLTSEKIVIEENELESGLTKIIQDTDPQETQKNLIRFGLDWDDLKSYLRERLLYRKIISRRFDKGVVVSIEEIEAYYEQVYVPAQRKRGMEPLPMIEILDRIETAIKQKEMAEQVQEWIGNLRREANIQIKLKAKKPEVNRV
jgi:peptidyl-prolyl cis-trans isomerase SurA